jgi:dTDP-4-amino-4,6-dideoxygalactose transaminase
MPYLQPPAGIPISLSEITGAALRSLGPSRSISAFSQLVRERVGVRYSCAFTSGRAALTTVLKVVSLSDNHQRNEVVIPAYTCFSVASAVVRAGLRIRLCDIDPHTLDYDHESLKRTDRNAVLAIVACSLFGILCDWQSLKEQARQDEVYLVDDAAQSFGISDGSAYSGTFGDVGFYSFGRGKNLTTYSGGMAVTNNPELAEKIERIASDLPRRSLVASFTTVVNAAAYSMLLRPSLYWIPNAMPFLHLGETLYDPEFDMNRMGSFQANIGMAQLSRIDSLNSHRLRVSDQLLNGLAGLRHVAIIGKDRGGIPYLRFPVLMRNRNDRDRALELLRKSGVGASRMYPSTIADIPGIGANLCASESEYAGARSVADRLLTLPTHPYVSKNDIDVAIQVISKMDREDRSD